MRNFLLISVAVLSSVAASAQDFSNKGKDFWVGYGFHVSMGLNGVNTGGNYQMVLYFATDSATTVKVSCPGNGYTTTYNIPANTIYESAPLPKSGAQDCRLYAEGTVNRGIHIEATKPVVAYAHIYDQAISGATLLFPTTTLGKEYYSVNFEQRSNANNANCFFYVIACDTGTTSVEITPSAATIGGWAANTTHTVNLTQGQVYNVMGTVSGNNGVDLTGSKIKSIASGTGVCKKIAVFSGSGKLSIKCPNTGAGGSSDNYMVQDFPRTAWGKKFLTVPAANYANDYFRVCVTDPATVVKLNGTTLTGLVGNFYYQFQTSTPAIIETDKPATVAQYLPTQGECSGTGVGDPEVIYLSPVEQNISKVILNSTPHYLISNHFVNVVLPKSGTAISSFKIDNLAVPPASFTVHPGDNNYVYLKQSVAAGQHLVQSDSGFNIIAYGYGQTESYGYNGGTNIKDLYTFISPLNPLSISTEVTACTGTPFYFSVTLPKHPDSLTSLIWDYHGYFGTHNDTLNAPLSSDSTYLIGTQQVWRYKLNHTHTFSPAGVYPITITAGTVTSEGCGNSVIIDRDLFVYDPPILGFQGINNGCVTDSVAFTDTTHYAGNTYSYKWWWDFGDGNFSTIKNPKHLYNAPGTYTVRFATITNVGCLSDTASRDITVTLVPSAKFGMSSPVCAGLPVTFSDSSLAYAPGSLAKWKWDFGDGFKITRNNGSDTVHVYNPWNPNISDTLWVVTNSGCTSPPFVRNFKVNPIPVASFNMPAGICLPADSAHFFDASTIADATSPFTYLWHFGDPGSGANDSSLLKNPVHYYNSTGPFIIKLTVTSAAGCVDDSIRTLSNVYAQAHADFTVNPEFCLNNVSAFTDISNGSGNTIDQWFWDFGDGTPVVNVQNPSHTYSTSGTKTVKHWVHTVVGCYSDTMTKTIIINPLPSAGFTYTGPFCETGTISFIDTSHANAGNIISWAWTFGDAGTSASQSPTHIYAGANLYTVTLKVTTDKNCISPVTSTNLVIHPLPVAAFNHSPVCLPYGVSSFTNTSSVADGTALSYFWNFGDPGSGSLNTSGITSPSHYFSTPGPYNVSLDVTSAPGCISTVNQQVSDIYNQPHAPFTVNPENCLNDVTAFTSNATGSGNAIMQYHWDFGDASSSALQNPTHTYLTAGTKTIRHWVENDKGCFSDTTTHTVVINPLPTGSFNFNTPSCETRIITFTDASLANVGALSTWTWNFDDPTSPDNTSSLQSPTHSFAAARTYNVTLTVTNSKGCISAVITKPVVINARPKAGYIIPEVCLSDTYAQFTDTSKIAAGTITAWSWNFGDPGSGAANTSTLQNPQHSYTAVGNYNVQLIVTSNTGCKDTIVQVLTINGSFPVANFTINNPATLCANDSIAIVNTSTVFPGNITKVEIYWDNVNFPAVLQLDDNPFPGKTYRHLYPNFQTPLTKTFQVRFRAYSGGVCVNDKLQLITVNAAPKVQFNNIPAICLDAAPYQITQASETGGVPGTGVYSGPGVTAGGLFSPSVTGPGTFTIKYIYTSAAAGCVDTISKNITVYQPPVADFNFSNITCEKAPISFTDNSSPTVGTLTTWTWNFGDGSPVVIRNSAAAFNHTFAAAGTYNVHLHVTTSNGCVSVDKILPVTVKPQPVPAFTFPASVCLPNATILFSNISSIADGTLLSYAWNFGDPGSGISNTSSGVSPSHTYAAVGPFSVNLQATSIASCVHDTTISLNIIHPQPKADFDFNKPSVCIGADVTFRDLSNGLDGTINQWNWKMGDGSIRNTSTVTYQYSAVNTYNVSLYTVNSHGCNSDTVIKQFTVYPYPVVDAGPDRVVLEGGSVTIEAVAGGNNLQFLWTPSTFLNDAQLLKPVASNLLNDMTYTLTVTAQGGCAAGDQVFIKLLKFPVIPNTFTPNNDGINDYWSIDYLDTYPGNRVQVFDRYGQLIFESYGYSKPWDGTYKGKPLPVGTYYYIIEPKNGRKPMTGYVTIIK